MCRVYMQILQHFIKGLEHLQILVSDGGPGTNLLQIPTDDCSWNHTVCCFFRSAFFSLSNSKLKFLHVFSWLDSSLGFSTKYYNIPLSGYTNLSIY